MTCLKWSASSSTSAQLPGSVGERASDDLAEVAPVEGAGELVGAGAQLGLGARLLQLGVGLPHLGHAAQQLVLEPPPRRDVAADAVEEQRAVGVAPRPQLLEMMRSRPSRPHTRYSSSTVSPRRAARRRARQRARSSGCTSASDASSSSSAGQRPADQRLAVRAPVDVAVAAVGVDASV